MIAGIEDELLVRVIENHRETPEDPAANHPGAVTVETGIRTLPNEGCYWTRNYVPADLNISQTAESDRCSPFDFRIGRIDRFDVRRKYPMGFAKAVGD